MRILRAMRSTSIAAASAVAFLSACSGSPAAPTDCEMAVTELEGCVATELDAPFSAECTADEARDARGLLDQLATSGCAGPETGKADGFWCGFWDPFGWCDEPPAPLGPEPSGSPTRYPILLAHGFNTSTTNFWRFNGVDVALAADGHRVVLGSVPPFDTSAVRATYLAQQVDALVADGAEKVNLICFSQGGVDCRYLASPGGLDYGDRIASITTISSPNHGTNIGDVATQALPGGAGATGNIVDVITSWYGGTFSDSASDSHFIDAMRSMSEAGMADFNRTVVDHPDVYYQSWAGFSYAGGFANPRDTIEDVCRDDAGELQMLWHDGQRDVMDPLLVAGAAIVAHGAELRPNDGVSTVESSHWRRFRGCIPADHLDQVGQIDDRPPDCRTGFDYIRFYRNIAFELAAMGF